jgi:5'-3' exonuclease
VDALSLFDADLRPVAPAAPAPATPSAPTAAPRNAVPPAPRPAPPAGPTLLAVDGNSLAHRAFHAYGAIGLGGAGGDRSALYGFLALLTALHDKTDPDGIVVGFDCRTDSVRKDRHPGYKANRPDKDPALRALLDLAPALLADLGVPAVTAEGWEADDVVGSAASTAEAAGWRCVVATSDRDAFALISEATTVLRLRSGLDNAVAMDPARLRREIGVAPEQYVELAALRGDTSDNLKGVPGIGPARAAALLSAYPTVEAAAADPIGCRSVIGPGPGQALLDDLADEATSVFLRNIALMTIRRDVPVDLDACRQRRSADALADTLDGWGLGHLAGRAAVALADRPSAIPPPTDADAPPS